MVTTLTNSSLDGEADGVSDGTKEIISRVSTEGGIWGTGYIHQDIILVEEFSFNY